MVAIASESLLRQVRESGLLSPGQLADLEASLAAQFADPGSLSGELVRRGWLTEYQAGRLLAGDTTGLVLGPYVLLEPLGAGGMGQVYKARHTLMDRVVALKVIRQDRAGSQEALARFRREIQAAARLSHPNVVVAHDATLIGDTLVYAMEYVEGIDLARLVQERGPLPVGLACECVRQAALGLAHAHARGLVHRDIKPANLMLTRGETGQEVVIKVLDLGLARIGSAENDGLTREGIAMGTPDYLAPEQITDSHTSDIRADIYSLGCTLYCLLSGRPPFAGGSMLDKLLKHREIDPAPLDEVRPDVPPAVVPIVARMMAKRPADRYPTPADVAAALAPLARVERTAPDLIAEARANQVAEPPASSTVNVALRAPSTAPLVSETRLTVPVQRARVTPGAPASESPAAAPGKTPVLPSAPAAAHPIVVTQTVALPAKRRPRRLAWIALAALAASAALVAAVITVSHAGGTLTVEVMERDVNVTVDGEVVTLNSDKLGQVQLRPGKHKLSVRRGEEELFTQDFELRSRGRELIRARWTPKTPQLGTEAATGGARPPNRRPAVIQADPSQTARGELIYERDWDDEPDANWGKNVWGGHVDGTLFLQVDPAVSTRGNMTHMGVQKQVGANCTIELRLKVTSANCGFNFGNVVRGDERYSIDLTLNHDGSWRIAEHVHTKGRLSRSHVLHEAGPGDMPWTEDEWFDLRVSSREEQITLFVNDTLLAEVTNPFPAPADATPAEWDMWLINNNAYSDKVARVAADHLRIWKLPPPPAEPGRRLHVAETFDDASKGPTAKSADREYGRKDGQWQLVEFANTGSRGGGHPIGGPPLYDLESEIRFRHSGGRPMLWFRALRGKDESRRLELALPDKPGQPWTLKRWVSASADGKRKEHSKVVAQGPADAPPVIHENEWNVVKIRALGPEITITVNGRLLTEFRDEPLPPGFLPHRTALEVVFVRSDEKVEGRMAVDHLYVWKLGESQP